MYALKRYVVLESFADLRLVFFGDAFGAPMLILQNELKDGFFHLAEFRSLVFSGRANGVIGFIIWHRFKRIDGRLRWFFRLRLSGFRRRLWLCFSDRFD